jgi:hypothetical protein
MYKNCAFYVKTRSCCHFAILLPYQNLLCINNFCKVAAIAAKKTFLVRARGTYIIDSCARLCRFRNSVEKE